MKTVLVTGATSMVGAATIKRFSEEGWSVIATERREDRAGLGTMPNVAVLDMDLGDPESIRRCMERVLAKHAVIDVLVNNAAYVLSGPFEACSAAQVRRQMEVSFFGVLETTRHLLPCFRRSGAGVVINVSSLSGLVTFPAFSVYHAARWALEGFTESLWYELTPLGIRTKLIESGGVKSQGKVLQVVFAADTIPDYGELLERVHKTDWFPAYSEPSEVANCIFLAATDGTDRLRYRIGESADVLYDERLKHLHDETYLGKMRRRFWPADDVGAKAGIDLSSVEFSQNPYACYDRIRGGGPVHQLADSAKWLVIGYAEAVTVLSQPHVFTSESNAHFDPVLLGCDPPEHGGHRKALEGAAGPFSKENLHLLAGRHREFCRLLLDGISSLAAFDVLSDYAMPLSSMVILDLMGIRTDRNEELRNWTLKAVSTQSTQNAGFAEREWLRIRPLVEGWVEYCLADPGAGGALAHIVHHSALGKKLSKDSLIDLTKILLVGGNETTPSLVASTLLILLRDPDLMERVREDRTLIAEVIQESLRLESPTQIIHRTARSDAYVSGTLIPAGAQVEVSVGAANRDPRQFDRPDEFVLGRRTSPPHLAFGYGPHYCIGAALAKQEATIALTELLERFPSIRLSESFKPLYRHSCHVRALASLEIVAT